MYNNRIPLRSIIVDLNREDVQQLTTLLAESHCVSVDRVFYGPEKVIDYLRENPVDVVFLGAQMFLAEGFNLLARIMKSINKYVTVVFLLGKDDNKLSRAIRDSGVDYLTRPVTLEQINEQICKLEMDRKTGLYRKKHHDLLEKIS